MGFLAHAGAGNPIPAFPLKGKALRPYRIEVIDNISKLLWRVFD